MKVVNGLVTEVKVAEGGTVAIVVKWAIVVITRLVEVVMVWLDVKEV